MEQIKAFIFLDIEGTGIDGGNEIIEIALVSIHRSAIRDGNTDPRVVDKLVICVDPGREVEYKESGLTQSMLSEHGKRIFDNNVGNQIALFLERQDQPASLIGHNGYEFDFLVLSKKLRSVGATIPSVRCGDSLVAFRKLQPGKPKGTPGRRLSPYSMDSLYREAFRSNRTNSHNAEADAIALMKVVINAGMNMCQWFDRNAIEKLPRFVGRSCERLNIP
ncbi:three prime repair exonuclease 2-like [Amphiura filiformis]|uniref:three prime repair exonuclease 2-like n=1 Tax=Amphiura filiformis TaxID=82378 RepID=UPI003B21B1FC